MTKKTFALIALFALLFFAHPAPGLEALPKPEGRVNDYARVISPEYRQKLQALIAEIEAKTSVEIAVVTMESIAPHDEISYARLLFDNWKIGKKGKDNGILVLLAVKERRWRIEAGYGVEGILPDGKCGEIGRGYMVPLFKQGKYAEGLYGGTAAIADIISRDSGVTLDTLRGVNLNRSPLGSNSFIGNLMSYIGIPLFFFVWNLPLSVFIGLPFTLIFAAALYGFNRITGLLIVIAYIASMAVRYGYRRKLPGKKRHNFFGPQLFGGTWTSTSGGWGAGGGGFGGGGFGGGGGGGGGAGGGF